MRANLTPVSPIPLMTHAGRSAHHPHRLAVDKTPYVLDDAGKIGAIVLHRHVAEVRREHDIVEAAHWMALRQRLHVEDIEPGTRDALIPEGGEQRRLVDDGTARRVDDLGGRL